MRLTTQQHWLRTIAWLRREFPSPFSPICVRSQEIPNLCGDTSWDGHRFLIRINKSVFQVKLDTLLHEWAHCLTWFGANRMEDHPGEWGLCHANILQAFYKWNFGKETK